jgi:hypothetical protein
LHEPSQETAQLQLAMHCNQGDAVIFALDGHAMLHRLIAEIKIAGPETTAVVAERAGNICKAANVGRSTFSISRAR